jgi:hypothetical protein
MQRILRVLVFVAVAVPSPASAPPRQLEARKPIPHQDLAATARAYEAARSRHPAPWSVELAVKFGDEVRARAQLDGSVAGAPGSDIAEAAALVSEVGARFRQLIRSDEGVLAALESRAAARSGRAQPDLAGMLAVELDGASTAELAALGERLQRLACVEFASLNARGVPPPGDIAPPTPNLVAQQTYRVDPPGLDGAYMTAVGATGSGVRLSDCEYGWNGAHEDLVDIDIHPEPGQTPSGFVIQLGWHEHGTAVIGETSSVHNAYGCSGFVADATVYTYPEHTVQQGARRETCIANALSASADGDVVMLEMQNGLGAPAEADATVWVVVKTGTDAGVIVVGAAGNGAGDLDSSAFAAYRALGDSGAIVVGGGIANALHDQWQPSTYGSRVDVQGWAENVFTLGYGSFAAYGNDPNQYYIAAFGGTSAATPFAASACVAVEDWSKTNLGVTLTSVEMRALLVQTGIPQGIATQLHHIGPFPDVQAAIEQLGCSQHSVYCTAKTTSSGCSPSIGDAGAPSVSHPSGYTFTTAALEPQKSGLTFFGVSGRVASPYQGGTMCVAAPRMRLAIRNTGGSASCSGAIVYTLADLLANASGGAAIVPGVLVDCQTWTRDPGDAHKSSFSNALEFRACP